MIELSSAMLEILFWITLPPVVVSTSAIAVWGLSYASDYRYSSRRSAKFLAVLGGTLVAITVVSAVAVVIAYFMVTYEGSRRDLLELVVLGASVCLIGNLIWWAVLFTMIYRRRSQRKRALQKNSWISRR